MVRARKVGSNSQDRGAEGLGHSNAWPVLLLSGPLRQAFAVLSGGPDRGHAFVPQGLAAGVRSGVCEGDRVGTFEMPFADSLGPTERCRWTDRLLRDRGRCPTNPIVRNRKESNG